MIITETKATTIISNPEVVGKIGGLARAHEEFKSIERSVKSRSGCSKCSVSDPAFQDFRSRAVNVLNSLSDDEIGILKRHLFAKQLTFIEVDESGKRKKVVR